MCVEIYINAYVNNLAPLKGTCLTKFTVNSLAPKFNFNAVLSYS